MSSLAHKISSASEDALTDVGCVLCQASSHTQIQKKSGYLINQCNHCGMIYVNPRPTPKSLERLYQDPASNHYNGDSAQDLLLEIKTLKKIIGALSKILPSGKILEVGCSNGDLLRLAQKKGYEVEGCDLVDQKACKQSAPFPIYERPLIQLKLPQERYDAIILRNTLEHYFDPKTEIAEIKRLLKTEGILYLKVPNVQFEQGLLCRLAFQVDNLFAPPYHLNHFSPKTLKRFLYENGFDLLSWQVEIPSEVPERLQNLARKLAYVFCLLSQWIPSQPLGSGVTLACVAKKRK